MQLLRGVREALEGVWQEMEEVEEEEQKQVLARGLAAPLAKAVGVVVQCREQCGGQRCPQSCGAHLLHKVFVVVIILIRTILRI